MKKILTIILDGLGMREDIYGNAVKNAGMNNFINIWNNYPHCLLKSSGTSVGLSDNQPGFSEHNHKVLGAGRDVENRNQIIESAINRRVLSRNSRLNEIVDYLKTTCKNIHLLFLVSQDRQCSDLRYLQYIITFLESHNITNIYIDLIADGQNSDNYFFSKIIPIMEDKNKYAKISSVCGEYYALDKSKNYAKTETYYRLLVDGQGVSTPDITKIINLCYKKGLTDEFLPPIKTKDYVPIEAKDAIFFLNYSRDNQTQILESLGDKDFDKFKTSKLYLKIYSFFEISNKIKTRTLFEEPIVENTLCEYIDQLGLSQAKIVETLKEESLMYYFDGEKNTLLNNCDTYLVTSSRVERFEKKPELNALAIAKSIIKCMENDYDFIIANFANPDILGHTGNYQATINGLQAVDVCLGKIIEVAKDNFYKVVIIGSHGNADTIIDRENNIVTKNTFSPVPFVILDKKIKLKNGNLKSFAPTILKYMDIAIPKEMRDTENLFIE